jgi:hypothetical protein
MYPPASGLMATQPRVAMPPTLDTYKPGG